jgi:hypothetical protein
MNVDHVLQTMNQFQVNYILIGGMNFMLRHKPLLTYDIDLWIEDTAGNLAKCEQALVAIGAEWGESVNAWGPVNMLGAGWLDRQMVFALTSPSAAVDIMRSVEGMSDWQRSYRDSVPEQTKAGTPYHGLSDSDMLQCQLALAESQRKSERVRILQGLVKP